MWFNSGIEVPQVQTGDFSPEDLSVYLIIVCPAQPLPQYYLTILSVGVLGLLSKSSMYYFKSLSHSYEQKFIWKKKNQASNSSFTFKKRIPQLHLVINIDPIWKEFYVLGPFFPSWGLDSSSRYYKFPLWSHMQVPLCWNKTTAFKWMSLKVMLPSIIIFWNLVLFLCARNSLWASLWDFWPLY